MAATVDLSVVIPVYNEAEVLPLLFQRLYPVLDGLDRSYEVVFVNDGSADRSAAMLADQFHQRPDVTRVASLSTNTGQHAALVTGFQRARGQYVVTLDADLQNPPEEIPRILAELDQGFDYVGSIRQSREDARWRYIASRMMNHVRERITGIRITDQGCMLRGYSRAVVQAVAESNESHTFIPALAYLLAARPTEILVAHGARAAGQSKYSLFHLIRLNFDLMTSFSSMPLQLISMLGIVVSVLAVLFGVFLAVRRLIVGPEAEGVFTLFVIAFFLMGLLLLAIGMVGEYVGRISSQVRPKKRYRVVGILEAGPNDARLTDSGPAPGPGQNRQASDET